MKKLPTFKRVIFPSLVGLVLTSSLFSFAPFQLANKVLSQSNEEIITPVASQSSENGEDEEERDPEERVDTGAKKQDDTNISKDQSVGSSAEVKDVAISSKTDKNMSSSQQTAKVTVDKSGIVTAKSTIVSSGKTIHLMMKYPKEGGAITGTIEGDCSGTVAGNYNPAGEGLLNGTAKAKCPAGIIPIPVTITYNSQFTPEDTEATFNYTVTALGKTQKGSTTLLFIS